jgi:hypothetical protein
VEGVPDQGHEIDQGSAAVGLDALRFGQFEGLPQVLGIGGVVRPTMKASKYSSTWRQRL